MRPILKMHRCRRRKRRPRRNEKDGTDNFNNDENSSTLRTTFVTSTAPVIQTRNLNAKRDLNPFGIDRIMMEDASKPVLRLL